MPHVVIEYSANLAGQLDVTDFLTTLRDAVVATGIFPIGGIRVRAYRTDHYVIADGDLDNAFIHITLRVRHGRDIDTRKSASQAVFAKVCEKLGALYDRIPLGISLEMQEIDATLSYKKNNLHEYVKRRATGGRQSDHSEPAARVDVTGSEVAR